MKTLEIEILQTKKEIALIKLRTVLYLMLTFVVSVSIMYYNMK